MRLTTATFLCCLFAACAQPPAAGGGKTPPQPSQRRQQAQAARQAASARLEQPAQDPRLAGPLLTNPSAYIPAQCYASTRDRATGKTFNSCFTCHQRPREPNATDDSEVQLTLSVPRFATENHWGHLAAPPPPVSLSDEAVLAHVRESNYQTAGGLLLAQALTHLAPEWDANHDGAWGGYVPDCEFHFDAKGFDRRADGTSTGWRAYVYAPVPGMFWPTNGSAGDAMVRLPLAYRTDATGALRDDLYAINLAILEAYLKQEDVPIDAVDERALGSDLDGDGKLGMATKVGFVWPPKEGRPFSYVGAAAALDPKLGWPAAGLYPVGAELLHSVRYLDVKEGAVQMAARMKELRYMRKARWLTYAQLQLQADEEAREKRKRPDKLKLVLADAERGVGTGTGWLMQGFIEDKQGALRPQSVEETTACIGCHGGVGAGTDSTFTLVRKRGGEAPARGWAAWGARGLSGLREPRRADGEGEYAHWLAQVGGGDDFRSNDEVKARFFLPDGTLKPSMKAALAKDISTLVVPSPKRALALNRAYLALVSAQTFEQGRDVALGAPQFEARLEQDGPTGIEQPVEPGWWSPAPAQAKTASTARRGRPDTSRLPTPIR